MIEIKPLSIEQKQKLLLPQDGLLEFGMEASTSNGRDGVSKF